MGGGGGGGSGTKLKTLCTTRGVVCGSQLTVREGSKLPMYLLFIWSLYLMVLRCATSLQGALEGVGPENRDFFGP